MTLEELNLAELFLTWIITYGAFTLALALFLGALGIPLPGTLLVLASGAFVRQGILDMYTVLVFGLIGVVVGDVLSYGVGHVVGERIRRRYNNSNAWQRAQKQFARRGGIAVYLTRWLITPLAVPTNLIAGSSHYTFGRFLAYDVAGEASWLLLYGGLGYTFGAQWELISDFAGDFTGLLTGLVILVLGLYPAVVRRSRHAA